MACTVLKRPLEWSPPSAHNSLYGHQERAAKRRCLSAMIKEVSHLADIQPKTLSSEDMAISIRQEMDRLYESKKLHTTHSLTTSSSDVSLIGRQSCSPSRADSPLFTPRQVGLICERILKERETQIREEYDFVLKTKLDEQYNSFVKFTYEQIEKRFQNGIIPSYMS